MLLETSRIKRIIAVVMIAMFLHSTAYTAQDALRLPVGRKDTYARISYSYTDSLFNIQQVIEQIANEDNFEIISDPVKLGEVLVDRGNCKIVKTFGRKIILISQDKRYFIKINHEEDFAYEKEKAFFMHGYNPLAETKLLLANDKTKICVFDNVNYNSGAILLFDYMHAKNVMPDQLESAIRYAAILCADIHKKPIAKEDMHMYQDQGLDEQEKRISSRLDYLKSAGYKDNLPDLKEFTALRPNVKDNEIVLNHGDFSPWNIFVDPWTGKPVGLIDGEVSSIGTRSKEIAKIIISLLDSRKNNLTLIRDFDGILSTFLSEYFKESGADQDVILGSVPYYLATQLLWYAESTDRTFKNQSWVKWRIELCKWALSQKTFSVASLKDFIEKETKDNYIDWAGDLAFIKDDGSYEFASGKIFKVKTGQAAKFSVAVTFAKPTSMIISAANTAVEFWTNVNTGIWQSAGSLEFMSFDNGKAYFSGELPIDEISGEDTPYEVTARVSLNLGNKKEMRFIELPYGNAKIIADFESPSQDNISAWRDSIDTTYGAVMLDFDGTMNFYNSEMPEDIKIALIDILNKGVNVAINSSRDDGINIGHFFAELKEKARYSGKDFDLNLCHVYLKNGKYGYNVGTGESYYRVLFPKKSKDLVNKLFKEADIFKFLMPYTYLDDDHRITFAFRGGIDREVFVRKLNEKLEAINKSLSKNEQVSVLYTDDFFEISPKKGTKATSLSDFSRRIGVPITHIARIGDQGQPYGLDEAMLDGPGGFSAYHVNPKSKYPINAPAMVNKRNADATAYLLKTLKFFPSQEIDRIQKPITATQL